MKNKTKSKKQLSPPLLSSQAQFHSQYSPPPPPQCHWRTRNGGRGQLITSILAAPSPSGGGPLTVFPSSRVGSLPSEAVLHELL